MVSEIESEEIRALNSIGTTKTATLPIYMMKLCGIKETDKQVRLALVNLKEGGLEGKFIVILPLNYQFKKEKKKR